MYKYLWKSLRSMFDTYKIKYIHFYVNINNKSKERDNIIAICSVVRILYSEQVQV